MYKTDQNKDEFWMAATKNEEDKTETKVLECCVTSLANDGKKCCKSKSKDGSLVDSGLSQVNCFFVLSKTLLKVGVKKSYILPFLFRSSWMLWPTT